MELKPAVPSGAFRGCSLVWPSVAQGGVAQLAVDLMLETLPLRLCAQADAAGLLLPFAADGPAGALTTAMQSMCAGGSAKGAARFGADSLF